MVESEYPLASFLVVCHTADCENDGIAIQVLADPTHPHVTCGPCAQPVTDITPIEET